MAKTSISTVAKICIAMARQPNKRFSSTELCKIGGDVNVRTIQRYLKSLALDGVVIADNTNPKGYKLAITLPKL